MERDRVEGLPTLEERGLYSTILSRAAWKPATVCYRGEVYALERGQFVISIRAFAAEWGISKSGMHRILKRLEKRDTIRTKSGTAATVITVCNYGEIPEATEMPGTLSGTPPGTRLGHAWDTEEGEEGKKGKKEEPPPIVPPHLTVVQPEPRTEYAWEGHANRRLTRKDYEQWKKAFPRIDLDVELTKADAWCEDHPEGAKGWFGLFARWLAKANDEAGISSGNGPWEGYDHRRHGPMI